MIARRTKVAYGVAHIGIFSVEYLIRFNLLKFTTDVVHLRADLAGYAVALGILWDAVTDPPMGEISDRTRSRWGRRRPWILAGGISLAFAVALLFSPPVIASQGGKFTFLLLSYIFMNTCITLISVPHYALGGEISPDSGDRTEAYGWLVLWGQVGSILGVVLPGLALMWLGKEGDETAGYQAYSLAGLWVGAVVLVSSLVTFFQVPEGPHPGNHTRGSWLLGFVRSVRSALRNRTFLPLLLMYMTITIGLSGSAVIALYFYEYRLELATREIYTTLTAFVVALCLSLPAWIVCARRLGKKWPALLAGILFGILTTLFYPILPPGAFWPALVLSCIGGVCGGSLVLLYSLATDVVDYDEVKSRQHREGLYFGLWNMGTKVSRALAVAVTGVLLQKIQFVPNQAQTAEVTRALSWIAGPGVGGFLILGGLIFLTMPMIENRHEQIRRILERRRARRNSGA